MSNDYKELRKSATNKTICGVCGGIGEYFKVDPTLIRLLWIIISLGSAGLGIVGYFIAAVVIPDEVNQGVPIQNKFLPEPEGYFHQKF